MYTENSLTVWVYIFTKPSFTGGYVLSKLAVSKPSHNALVAKSKWPTVQHSLGVSDTVACVPVVLVEVNFVSSGLGEKMIINDELLLRMVWLAIELIVVVLGKLDATQLGETGEKEINF